MYMIIAPITALRLLIVCFLLYFLFGLIFYFLTEDNTKFIWTLFEIESVLLFARRET